LFIDLIDAVFLMRIDGLRQHFADDGLLVLVIDMHSTYMTSRVTKFCEANDTMLIWLVAHSSYILQPFDLFVLAIFKILSHKEKQTEADERNEGRDTKDRQCSPFFRQKHPLPSIPGTSNR
jgi:hypothetical protein